MMRRHAGWLLLLAACSPRPAPPPQPAPQTQPVISPARGLSCNGAIPMTATTEQQGIAEEHRYVDENYPGAAWKTQSLSFCPENRPVDVVKITTANGVDRTLYFDISGWFGKH